jgi:hypothetical protein
VTSCRIASAVCERPSAAATLFVLGDAGVSAAMTNPTGRAASVSAIERREIMFVYTAKSSKILFVGRDRSVQSLIVLLNNNV